MGREDSAHSTWRRASFSTTGRKAQQIRAGVRGGGGGGWLCVAPPSLSWAPLFSPPGCQPGEAAGRD